MSDNGLIEKFAMVRFESKLRIFVEHVLNRLGGEVRRETNRCLVERVAVALASDFNRTVQVVIALLGDAANVIPAAAR